MFFKVLFRGKQQRIRVEDPPTVGSLRQSVLSTAQAVPIQVDVLTGSQKQDLRGQEIWIFQAKVSSPMTLLTNDEELLGKETEYYCAYEIFGTVPVDLFRTVKLSRIHPAVKSLHPNASSEVAPVYCAALTPKEAEFPPYHVSNNGARVLIRGASLQSCDRSTESTTVMPWDDVYPLMRGRLKLGMDLGHAEFQNTYDEAGAFGILHTTKMYGPEPAAVKSFTYKEIKLSGKKSIKRDCFWHFKLPKGTDLRDVGVSVILDKEDGHFSLIPNTRSTPGVRLWGPVDRFRQPHLIEPDPDQAAPPAPESIDFNINGTDFVAFPLAAKKFMLHDILMRAAGLPYDGNVGADEEDKKKLGAASNVLFEHSHALPNTYQVSEGLDALSSSLFNMKSVPAYVLEILFEAMEELTSTSVDVIDKADENALVDGMEVIDKHFKSGAAGTPPLANVPDTGPPVKVARTE